MACAFWKFSTAGNTTLFLDQPLPLREAMQIIPAEQAGYADLMSSHLQMAGGELCINAAIAFAAFADMLGKQAGNLQTAGQIIACGATGKKPHWQAWINFDLSCSMDARTMDAGDEIPVRYLPGISHALIKCTRLPEPGEAMNQAPNILKNLGLDDSAAGVVWWRSHGEEIELTPVVSVPKAETFNLEGACGSASLAVAMSQPNKKSRIRQPSGEYLTVEIGHRSARIEAPVTLLASGEVWH